MSDTLATKGSFELCFAPDPECGDYFVSSTRTGLIIWEGRTEAEGRQILDNPQPHLDHHGFPADLY